ncbi:hypothetical protein JOM56_003495 [Amanita muscaria]
MFRLLPRPVQPFSFRRSLASTVLLNRSWEQETVATLRTEARSRGLSTKGNKATIIARIQQHDIILSTPTAAPSRHASTEVGIAPGIPPASETARSTTAFSSVTLPDLTKPYPTPPIQVPYLPDFWESSTISKKAPEEQEQPLPKILLVAGGEAHHISAVTQSLEDTDTAPTETVVSSSAGPQRSDGIVSDVLDDLGLGSWAETKKNWRKFLS